MQKLPPVAERFIEDFGLSLDSQGFSRTAGRLLPRVQPARAAVPSDVAVRGRRARGLAASAVIR
jgi:hypothetical protein